MGGGGVKMRGGRGGKEGGNYTAEGMRFDIMTPVATSNPWIAVHRISLGAWYVHGASKILASEGISTPVKIRVQGTSEAETHRIVTDGTGSMTASSRVNQSRDEMIVSHTALVARSREVMYECTTKKIIFEK